MKQRSIHIKVREELHARVRSCASLEGLSVPEIVRRAILTECERIEKLAARRERVHRRAEGGEDS